MRNEEGGRRKKEGGRRKKEEVRRKEEGGRRKEAYRKAGCQGRTFSTFACSLVAASWLTRSSITPNSLEMSIPLIITKPGSPELEQKVQKEGK